MNAIALITQRSDDTWHYDKIMAAIAFDIEVTVVFVAEGLTQMHTNKAWKSLAIYGVEQVFYVPNNDNNLIDTPFNVSPIDLQQLRLLMAQTEMIL